MNHWYIWYEIYEDGELLANSKGRYCRAYQHKSSAERRAKQMWSKDLFNPMTGTIISRKWIVSQTCPWEDVYIFKTMTEGENFVNTLLLIAQKYGIATRADAKELLDQYPLSFIDHHFGWLDYMIESAQINPIRSGHSVYLVALPKALPID